MATVSHKTRPDGSHALGVTVDKVFVPLVTVDAARFEQLRENAAQRAELEGDSESVAGTELDGNEAADADTSGEAKTAKGSK